MGFSVAYRLMARWCTSEYLTMTSIPLACLPGIPLRASWLTAANPVVLTMPASSISHTTAMLNARFKVAGNDVGL